MPGILYNDHYLDTLRSTNDFYSTFPSNQTTYTYTITGTVSTGWVADVSWITLIVDPVAWYGNGNPNFYNSQVVGYYSGGSTSQYATGVLSLPQYLYTGPILPTSDRNVPITIVQVKWTRNGETHHHRFGLIQEWEPGVTILDPTEFENFNPIETNTATLLLSVEPNIILWSNIVRLRAISDIPMVPSVNQAYFYLQTATNTLLGTANFTATIDPITGFNINAADFYYNSLVGTLVTGTNIVFATFPGVGFYTSATSNSATIEIISGTPLVVSTQTITPNQVYYSTQTTATYNLTVISDPSYPPNLNAVTSTVILSITDQFQPVQIISPFILSTTSFSSGTLSQIFTITNELVDFTLSNTLTQYFIISDNLGPNQYTATIRIENTHDILAQWQQNTASQHLAGSTSLSFISSGIKDITIQGQAFPIHVSTQPNPSIRFENFSITVDAANRSFLGTITLYVSSGTSTSSVASYTYSSTNTNNIFTTTLFLNTVGNYSIYAGYPGDLGTNIYSYNLSTQSNIINHQVVGRDLPTTSSFTSTYIDRILITTTYTGTLTEFVSFFEGGSFLGTATWIKQITTVTTGISGVNEGTWSVANFRNFWPQSTPYWITSQSSPYRNYELRKWNNQGTETRPSYPFNYYPNNKTLWKYKTISESSSTWRSNNIDTLVTVTSFTRGLGPLGYNVIGFQTPSTVCPTQNLPRPITVGVDTFELVEYLGYNPSPDYLVYIDFSGVPRVRGGIWHFYRFTPEIPPSGNSWDLRRDYTPQGPLDTPSLSMSSQYGGLNPDFSIGNSRENVTTYDAYGYNPGNINPPIPFGWATVLGWQPRLSSGNWLLIGDSDPVNQPFGSGYYPNTPPQLGKQNYWFNHKNWTMWRAIEIGNTFRGWQQVSTSTVSGFISADQTIFQNVYMSFANQVWTSNDLNDVDQNEIARRSNNWFNIVSGNNNISLPAFNYISTVTTIVQTATLVVNSGTIINPNNLTASWPGTLNYGPEYGSFNSFNISITYP